MHGKVGTYEYKFTAKSHRGSLDELRVMQRPTLRATVSATTAAELERQRGGERRMKKKEEGPTMPIYKEIGEQAGAKIEEG